MTLYLEGPHAQRGLPLAALEGFIDRLSRALVDFDRSTHGQQTRRTGRRTAREELLLAFRVVALKPGSAVIELEPVDGERPEVLHAETLAVHNLRALLDVIENAEEVLDPVVTQSVEAARRALGAGGRIGVVFAGHRERPRRVTIDEERVEELARRKPARQEIVNQVSGRLTMVDIEPPFRVAIRSASGVKWNCRYSASLEERVASLLKRHVVARGAGVRANARRGYFEIDAIDEVPEFEQTELFSVERRPLDALVAAHKIAEPPGWAAFADPSWRDEPESEAYLRALLSDQEKS